MLTKHYHLVYDSNYYDRIPHLTYVIESVKYAVPQGSVLRNEKHENRP
jgi:hypothetical protein